MLMLEYDYDTDIAVQREEAEQIGEERGIQIGEARGEERGIQIGEMKKAKETAMELYTMGMNEENIAKATKTSLEQIQQWIAET